MRAIVIPEPWKAVTAEREVPVPKQGEVLLKTGLRRYLRK